VLTISRQSRWSINYYNDTANQAQTAAMDRQRANGGLGEYYSERDKRTPTWLIAGDPIRTVELVGLGGRAADGGPADPEVVQRWLDDGIAPNGEIGRAFGKTGVHPIRCRRRPRISNSRRWRQCARVATWHQIHSRPLLADDHGQR